ncbi:UDP-N-acetylmuramoyl-tripeptide--D-alanyl-D-alanine ligase [Ferribacterium limneticum]|uniref:UDP-N-acetylmuramoyl-tripeptide--D-alanyl-D- alanine ligase n=1 Tax=Ferribacterium limneticum TaxID=76259 RepID=UPI001CFA37B9|nr:UDP-N-acetylmuramoyl-tripeptide--D-alanyl-D-alanine ligase [Ferribacterium limneticum]UCV27820.1 UDP-N-acetylmuramoyl-tripeptide--D-alanyl-D-alanine ligase [Ferribacterium limneticum]UCV31737.1 UDP-N-acetylmuramoyl-tripeptide--D-alanyl-D-alanine ligase [Ferribacterium limneticum]
MNWLLSQVAQAVQGRLIGADVPINGVSTDTRAIADGQLFVALAGERFDAHDFLAPALAAGATALLVADESKVPAGVSAVIVDDTRLALGRLAAAWRAEFNLPVIAVTGSNGKTTTKEMVAAILKAAFGAAVLSTRGNLNNDIGLPLTLLGLRASHRAAVIEMGMNHPGEIAYLAPIGAPTVALVTNAQRAHLEGMGDLDEVAREKGAIFGGLPANGVAVINADDAYAGLWRSMAEGRPVRTFGIDHTADVSGKVRQHGLEIAIELAAPEGRASLTLSIPGRHNARNAVAAAAACLAAGIPMTAVVAGLEAFSGVKGRLQRRVGKLGAEILDDTYNANPDSVRAGIDVLAATIGRKLLVLGDMGEIGEASGQYHDEIGGYAKSQGIDRLFALGDAAQLAVRNFGEGAKHYCNVDKLIAAVEKELGPETTVLVKGSRFMKMERVADALAAPVAPEEAH